MTSMLFSVAAFAAAALCFGLSGLLLVRRASEFHRRLAWFVGLTGTLQLLNGMYALDAVHGLLWRRLGVTAELAQPPVLLAVVLCLLRAGESAGVRTVLWWTRAVGLIAAGLAVLVWSDDFYRMLPLSDAAGGLLVAPYRRVPFGFLLLAWAIGVAQSEQLYRAAKEPLRSQLKFLVIGLIAIGGSGIYQSSRLLLIPVWRDEDVLVSGLATLVSVGVIAYGLARARLAAATGRLFISPQAIYGSLSLVIIGLYLLLVGVVGEAIRVSGVSGGAAISAIVVFVAVIGLAVLLLSRRARSFMRIRLARSFSWPKYDYRSKWLEVTGCFRGCTSHEDILDRLTELLNRTFAATRITVWLRIAADGRYHRVRSIDAEPQPPPLDASHPVMRQLLTSEDPVEVAPSPHSDPFFAATDAVLCVPIRAGGDLLAFVTLSREIRGERYGVDDRDLLCAISHHVGVLLSQALLAEERKHAAQLEALHRLSAFCLHDLKNLAARLSLVAQNAETHGADPAFSQSAMRTVRKTVEQMTTLIAKLSRSEVEPGSPEPVDVRSLIEETFGLLGGGSPPVLKLLLQPVPPVLVVREQLQQVLVNLVLNAQQATGAGGEVLLTTEPVNGSVVITVADTGPGLPPERLQTLFRPFRSSKANGLGIGLYQCKQIVEAHHGTIRVESVEGSGTRVRIELPMARSASAHLN